MPDGAFWHLNKHTFKHTRHLSPEGPLMAEQKGKSRPVCKRILLRCDKHGKPSKLGHYWVCPGALEENDPAVFNEKVRTGTRRLHADVRIEMDPKFARVRRKAAQEEVLTLFDPSVGRRPAA